MNFEYQLKESDERYFLKERHRKTNMIYFVLFSIFYIAINIPMLMKKFWLFFTICIFFIIVLGFVLWGCNFVFTFIELKLRQKGRKEDYINYHFSVTKRGITQSTENLKKEVLWKDIKKIKVRRNYIFVEPKKNEVAFIFQKNTMGETYEKLVEIIVTNMKLCQNK
jgi:hypothetical protein